MELPSQHPRARRVFLSISHDEIVRLKLIPRRTASRAQFAEGCLDLEVIPEVFVYQIGRLALSTHLPHPERKQGPLLALLTAISVKQTCLPVAVAPLSFVFAQ